jgi:hypothetical protein
MGPDEELTMEAWQKMRPAILEPVVPAKLANDIQHGGDHYKKYGDLQPWDLWAIYKLDPYEAAMLKYLLRWKDKDGVIDLEKLIHVAQKRIELHHQGYRFQP